MRVLRNQVTVILGLTLAAWLASGAAPKKKEAKAKAPCAASLDARMTHETPSKKDSSRSPVRMRNVQGHQVSVSAALVRGPMSRFSC